MEQEISGEKISKYPKYINIFVDEMTYLENLLNEYETKINVTLKTKNRFSIILKENKKLRKRAIKAIDHVKTIRERDVRKEKKERMVNLTSLLNILNIYLVRGVLFCSKFNTVLMVIMLDVKMVGKQF